MRKKWIYLLMAVTSTMLVSLIVIQVMWLLEASKAEYRERQFRVGNALKNVSVQLVNNNFCFESYGKVFVDLGDRFFMMHHKRDGKSDTVGIYYDEAFTRDKERVGFMNTMKLSMPFTLDVHMRATVVSTDTTGYASEKNSFYETLHGARLNDVIRNKKPIDSLLDMAFVDSLIRTSLEKEHLDPHFGFGIINLENNKIACHTRVADSGALLSSPFSAALFTDNRFMSPYKLALVFPDTPAVYFTNYLLLLSIAVVLLLTFSFYGFVRLYLRQDQLSKMKSDFIHNLTHEFNTPMANISLALETLEDSNKSLDPKTTNVFNIISAESVRLRENIERSLQVAVMDEGALLLHKEEVDVAQLLHTVLASYTLQCDSLGGKIMFESTANPIVYADETHLLNSIVNLLDNAIKYRQGIPEIVIRLEEKNNELLLTVADNGIGMSSETQKHIFDKFFRAHEGDTHNTKGFGLGLSYVKGIITAHGGTIEVWSKKGIGSKFFIRLPLRNRNYGK